MHYSRFNVIANLDAVLDRSVIHNLFHGAACVVPRDLADRLNSTGASALRREESQFLRAAKLLFGTEQEEADLIGALKNRFLAARV